MNALLVLYAGGLSSEAEEAVACGKSGLSLALERSRAFPGVRKTVLLAGPSWEPKNFSGEGVSIENRGEPWTTKTMLQTVATHSHNEGRPFDLVYFAWADCPFLDPDLAGRLANRHLRHAAEYSYADGWPYGLAPELLSPGTAAILAAILGENDGGPVGRDALFSVIQKDINAFDIETEISSVDLRGHRINLCADSKRNLLLLRRFAENASEGKAGIPDTADVERIIAEKPGVLRTLPAFYPIQVYAGCPQSCTFCPWPSAESTQVTERRDYMKADRFELLLEKIVNFSGDAVIDLSLWGELSLHPQKLELIEAVLRRPELALVIETSGIGWKNEELQKVASLPPPPSPRRVGFPSALSWIVSLDTADPARYREIRGAGFAEASECAKKLAELFPKNTYVQAIRAKGAEDDMERFYRFWNDTAGFEAANIIIQKHDDFCGTLPKRQASDLSPVQRHPCWHMMRDMPILIDGTVPLCREQICSKEPVVLGNAGDEALETIWERGGRPYDDHACGRFDSFCVGCDEYYTYNF